MIFHLQFYTGTLSAPLIYHSFGYGGTYTFGIVSGFISLLYLLFCVKDVKPKILPKNLENSSAIKRYFITPLKDLIKTLSMKRPENLRSLVWLQYLSYGLMWFALSASGAQDVVYLYLLTEFESFDESKYAYIQAYQSGINAFSFFIIIPFMSNYLKLHDITIQMISCMSEVLSSFFYPLVNQEWQLYFVTSIGIMNACKWSLARSILSKSVERNELGKALSGIAIVAAAMPFVTTPAIRELYKATIDIFPGCFALLCGAAMLFAFEINGILYTEKHKLNGELKSNEMDVSTIYSKGILLMEIGQLILHHICIFLLNSSLLEREGEVLLKNSYTPL